MMVWTSSHNGIHDVLLWNSLLCTVAFSLLENIWPK